MKGTMRLSLTIQRARMKHALAKAKKLREARFPKPRLVTGEGHLAPSRMAEEAQAVSLIGPASVERAFGKRTS